MSEICGAIYDPLISIIDIVFSSLASVSKSLASDRSGMASCVPLLLSTRK